MFVGQIMIYGDGSSQGIAHAETINQIKKDIQLSKNADELSQEFDSAIEGLGEVDYFSVNENKSKAVKKAQSKAASGLNITGYVGQYGTNSDLSKVKILIFNDWDLAAEAYANADGSFSVSAGGLGASTNVKIECDGYLPRFYKNMGHGSYQFGTADNPEMLYPGDSTYNENDNDQWSDEVINANDASYVRGFIGLRKATGDYVADYDFNDDKSIDNKDLELIEKHFCDSENDPKYLEEMDFNDDKKIDEDDYNFLILNEYIGAYKGDDDFKEYMDKDKDGVITEADYNWFAGYASLFDGYTPGANYIYNIKLTGDCYNETGMWLYNTNLDLNGHELVIVGNMAFMTSNLDLLDGVTLNLNGGQLGIIGEFNFGQAQSYDKLIMTNSADVLMVTENWYYTTLADCEGLWTDGLILFYGQHWNVNEAAGEKAIYSSGNHSIVFYYPYGKQTILWDNPETYINNEDGSLNTQRRFNFDNPNGLIFPYGYSSDRYWFRPWFRPYDEPDYTLYRKGMEIGDGVHIATGNYTKSFTDLSIASPGVKSDFVRTYNSMNEEEGSFGIGWDFNIDVSKIVMPAEGYYQVVLPDGSNTTFKSSGNGFECLNAHSKMEKDGDGYIITNAAQSKYHFTAKGELDWVKDAEGNILTISAMSNNQRIVTDSTGRTYKINYNGNKEHLRVTKIEDTSAGRTVTYRYNGDFQLISATSVSGGTEKYEYDGNGRLCKITNCYDEITDQINYLSHGEVNYLINSAGLKQEYTYDKGQKQTGLKEYDGDKLVKTFKYDYDEKYAVKTNTVETDGQTYEVDKITYNMVDGKNKYDEMSESVDIMGNTTKYERDENGNVTKTINPDGTYTLANYNDKNSLIASVDEMGYATIKAYDKNGTRILKEATSVNPISQADINTVTSRNFNPITYLAAHESSYAITSHEYYADSYVSGIVGLIKKTTDPVGNITEYDYYKSGNGKGLPKSKTIKDGNTVVNSVEYEYNSQLQVSKEKTSVDISKGVYAVKEYEYDKFNNVTKVKDFGTGSTAAVTISEYDKLSRKTAEYSPNYSADKSHGTLTEYYPSGSVKKQTDALGNVTSFKYDAYGNVTEKTNPDKTINITEYDGLQREKATYFKWKAEAEKQILTSTEYEFVKHGFNVYTALDSCSSKSCSGLKTIKTNYITAEKQVLTETLADFRGNPVTEKTNGETKRTSAYYANGQLARQTDALRNTTKYEYGYLNKLTTTYTPFSGKENYSITKNEYDKNGNIVLTRQTVQKQDSSDKKYSITQNKYNAMGLLVQVTLSGTDSKDKNISKYFYNNAGVQIKMYTGMSSENDTSYLTTNYEYDNWLRAVRTTDSTGYNSGTITYDLNGNVLTNTDANGNVTTNTYDALNRVLTSKTVNSKDSSKNVSKSYEYDNMGRISRAINNDLTTTYSYDDLGRKIEEIESKDGYSTFKGFFYEGVSQYTRQQIVGINNLLMYSYTSYEYDGEMRLTKVKETGEETVSYTYDRNGNKKSETLANGVVSTYDYNNANRIVKLVNKKGNSTISSYEYSYYLDGSDACKVTEENGIIETTEYEYDGLKRLTNEEVKKGNTTDTYAYEYDDYGNRSKMTATGSEEFVTEYSYNNAQGSYTALLQREVKTVEGKENPLDLNSNVKQTVYTYDANGNQITKTAEGKTETNTYDGLNQLIGFTDGETIASYKYNASGLRYEKTVNGETINHVWDGNKQIVADVIDNQFYEADCYIRGTNLVAKYNYWNGKKTEYTYYTQNAHGDVVNLTDKDGKVTKSYRYDAFGVEKNIDENDTNAFRYCGEYYDKETATVYLRARYYNPSTGRFISRDSYVGKNEEPLSLNRYTYCYNNPIISIDPSGMAKSNPWDTLPYPGYIHNAVQNEYLLSYPDMQKEYVIPDTKKRIDLYQPTTKEAWEVKPFGSYAKGVSQLKNYIDLMDGRAIQGEKLKNFEFHVDIFTVNTYSYSGGMIMYNFYIDPNVDTSQIVKYLKNNPKVSAKSIYAAMLEPSEVYGPVTYNSKMKTEMGKQDKSGNTWLDYDTDLTSIDDLYGYDLYGYDNKNNSGNEFVVPPVVEFGLVFGY